ncbi:MAG: ABC transporter permease [Gemmatales bacterium]|nr:ABC transporter permease [Gemmatales bacterium]MDW8386478.1 ABC transporter permease [Gemmatales bacterium]
MFAVLIKESENATLNDIGPYALHWLIVTGIMAIVVLVVGEIYRLVTGRGTSLMRGLTGRLSETSEDDAWKLRVYRLFVALIPIGVAVALGLYVWSLRTDNPEIRSTREDMARWAAGVAGLLAVLAVSWEFLLDLSTISPRRVWAIARVSMTEAIRRKSLWGFVVILAVFLFASWFIQTDRPEHQWRIYVQLVFLVMTMLLLITASIIACFSLPNDIKQQTIHTIITKPVRRFELVLGRILGFTLLMSAVLLVMSQLSLLYVFRGIDESAKEQSMRARVPVFGQLQFEELDSQMKWRPTQTGIRVGREWEYRSYIRGGSAQEAVWRFSRLPASLTRTERMIPVEFTFDIFRTSKGGEDYKEGVSCQLAFVNPNKWDFGRYADYRKVIESKTADADDPHKLAREFGYYELKTPLTVVDYQTYTVWFPSSLLEDLGNEPFEIRVACRSTSQYLGMARADLYILAEEASFYLNFMKGTVGIWFVMVVMITLGVVFSTYLNALVSLMLSWFMLLCGIPKLRGFIKLVGSAFDPDNNPGGGPMESVYRLLQNKGLTAPLEESRGVHVLQVMDDAFRLLFNGLLAILPDLGHYTRTDYVAEGFNIPGTELAMSFLILLAYLFPFLLAAYYLMNAREIAN